MEQGKRVNVWYDAAVDFLDVTWARAYGYFTPTEGERVLVRVDLAGNILGFKIEEVSSLAGRPLQADLLPLAAAAPVKA